MSQQLPYVLVSTLIAVGCGADDPDNSSIPGIDIGVATDMGGEDLTDDAQVEDDGPEVDVGPIGVEKLFALGPHPVGFIEFDVSYTPPGATEPRVLPVKAWYPAIPDSGAEPAQYAVANIVDVTTDVALDGPDAAEGRFGVVVYSHGSGGEGLLGYPFGENFASWGWVVVSPNHVGNTALDGIRGEFAPFAANLLYRVTDITALLDAIEAETTASAIDGHADVEDVLLFGHSFGGYTTLASAGADFDFDALAANCPTPSDDGSCGFLALPDVEAAFRAGFGDPRIDAAVAQAPFVPQFADGALAGIDIPTMIQSGDRDATTPSDLQAEPAWNALDGPDDVWVRIPDGGHFTFISICYDLTDTVLRAFRPEADDDGCGEDFIDARQAVPVVNAYLRAFAETHLQQSDEWTEVLDGTVSLDDGFVVTAR